MGKRCVDRKKKRTKNEIRLRRERERIAGDSDATSPDLLDVM